MHDKVKQKILLLLDKLSTENREKCSKEIIRILKASSDGQLNKLQGFFGVPFSEKKEAILSSEISLDFSIPDLIENIRITDSCKNLRFLLMLYKLTIGENDLYSKIKSYEELLGKRNILAHVSQTKTGDTYTFKSRIQDVPDYVLTEQECLTLRKTILELSEVLDQIT